MEQWETLVDRLRAKLDAIPPVPTYVFCATLMCLTCSLDLQQPAPSVLSALAALLGTNMGQFCVINLCVSVTFLWLRGLQLLVFGRLRSVEWQRFWERLATNLMGQLVVLGAVVEPDLAELCLWGGFSALIGVLSLCAGLARDRLEYMMHLPELPTPWAFGRVVGFAFAIFAVSLVLNAAGIILLWEASFSTLALFLFPCWLLSIDVLHSLVHVALQVLVPPPSHRPPTSRHPLHPSCLP